MRKTASIDRINGKTRLQQGLAFLHRLRALLRIRLRVILMIPVALIPINDSSVAQLSNIPFVSASGVDLQHKGYPFYAVGVNSYYLQHIAVIADTNHVREVFEKARHMNITTIRTWGFHDARDSLNRAAIQWGPGLYNESGLKALDFVIAMAGQYGIFLIIPFVNGWDDYGGMNMYVRWYADRNPGQAGAQAVPQQVISGVKGRQYSLYVTTSLTHDDFYRIPEIRGWYKQYVSMLLNRVNTITGTAYKDDPTIMMWELANEPRSSDPTGEIVYQWMTEMAAFIKSLDSLHLLATGEEGFDIRAGAYSDISRYNHQGWLFDGTAGVSFTRSITIDHIDVSTVHCYPETWNLSLNQGTLWFRDHRRISHAVNKPIILEEFGSRDHAAPFYEALFSEVHYGGGAGIVLWQFSYDGRSNTDGYAFYWPGSTAIVSVVTRYGSLFKEKVAGRIALPSSTYLLQNYPNPFNSATTIRYSLSKRSMVQLNLFTTTGQRMATLMDEEQQPGIYHAVFEPARNASGAYILRLQTQDGIESRKVMIVR